MIDLSHVHKRFGQRTAVHDLTLRVPAGEIYGLLGHNGAGKSTAIGMMLGQVWPTAGEVRIFDRDVTTERNQALQKVGAIFEAPAFYDYLSGLRNLEILSAYTARTSASRIREVVEWVGLTGRETSKVRTYSHGMRARLALAQALLPGPEILILDEPEAVWIRKAFMRCARPSCGCIANWGLRSCFPRICFMKSNSCAVASRCSIADAWSLKASWRTQSNGFNGSG